MTIPTISEIWPNSGPAGTQITITGCSPQKFRPSLCGLLFQAIFMMQTAEHRSRIDAIPSSKHVPPDAGRNLGLRRFRNSRSQRRVRPSAIVVGHEFGDDRLQMTFVERNQVIQALPPNCSNKPFAEGVGGWSSWRRFQHADAESSQRRIEMGGEDGVAIMNHQGYA